MAVTFKKILQGIFHFFKYRKNIDIKSISQVQISKSRAKISISQKGKSKNKIGNQNRKNHRY